MRVGGEYWKESLGLRYSDRMGTEIIPELTYEEFRQLPDDGKRYELIRGYAHLIPTPSTRHQLVLGNLSFSLGQYISDKSPGEVLFAPLDVLFSEDTALQPDLIFVSNSRTEIIEENFIVGAPDLVVEILSPSSDANDRATKLPLYAGAGVPEVWLIEPQAKTVDVLKLQGKKYLVDSTLAGEQVLSSPQIPGWQLPLNELFDFRSRF